jgi:hypothetical protein
LIQFLTLILRFLISSNASKGRHVCLLNSALQSQTLLGVVLSLATAAKGASQSREFGDLNRKVIDVEKKMMAIIERERVNNDIVDGTHSNRRHSFLSDLYMLFPLMEM